MMPPLAGVGVHPYGVNHPATVRAMAPPESSVSRRAQRVRQRRAAQRTRILWIVGAVVVLALAGVGIWAAVGGDDGGDADEPFAGTVLSLELGEYFIRGELTAPPGPVRLDAVNIGAIGHNVGIRRGRISNELATGESVQLEVGDLVPGEYELYCDIPGHVEQGMVATLTVG